MKITSDHVVGAAMVAYIARKVINTLYPNEVDNEKIDVQIANEIIKKTGGSDDQND